MHFNATQKLLEKVRKGQIVIASNRIDSSNLFKVQVFCQEGVYFAD